MSVLKSCILLRRALYEGMAGDNKQLKMLTDVPIPVLPEEDATDGPRRSRRARPAAGASTSSAGGGAAHAPVVRMAFATCKEPSTGTRVPISECDLVLMSYEVLRKELAHVTGSKKGPGSALQRYGFWRIMLDEAQLVANSNSVAAQMASSLWRRHAWVVTGGGWGVCAGLWTLPFLHFPCWSCRGLGMCPCCQQYNCVLGTTGMRESCIWSPCHFEHPTHPSTPATDSYAVAL